MKQSFLIVFLYCLASVIILVSFNGTGGEADSINHYLHAKFAFQHPSLFLNHWAKPFFTLLASPFAQFGFIGIKIFNVICSLIATFFTYKIATALKLNRPFLAPLFLFLFPLSFLTTFSGLTEPLCAALLSIAIYATLKQHHLWAAIIVSFIPFVRSEGLLFLMVFASYWAIKKQWKVIPFLIVGHLCYSIIGAFHYEDFFWVFTKIPYATLSSHYGDGKLFHFADKLIYITGIPLLVFLLVGILNTTFQYIRSRNHDFFVLILLNFLVFFIAHSLFWYLGIFNSMGLKRVFAATTPLMAIVVLSGFNLIDKINLIWLKNFLLIATLIYILIFPFTSNPAAIDWKKEMNLTEAENVATDLAQYIHSNKLNDHRFIYTDPFLGEALKIDPFDAEQRLILSEEALKESRKGDLIIWDNWHSVIDYKIEIEDLKQYKEVERFESPKSTYVLFLVE